MINNSIKDTYRKRLEASVSIQNKLCRKGYEITLDNAKIYESNLLLYTAQYLNTINCLINERAASMSGDDLAKIGKLKKTLLDTITILTGCALSAGNGLTEDKYANCLESIINTLDRDLLIE